jgi:threonine/homoserine/homoserine lactone efflux protein
MRTIVREGFVVGVLNPKAALFLAAILPQFVIPGAVPVALQIAMLGLVFVLVALVCDSVWGLVAGSARERLVGRPRLLEALGAVGGGVVVALGLRLAFSARTP